MSDEENNRYLIFADQRFRKAAVEELGALFPGSELRSNRRYGGEVLLLAEISKPAAKVASVISSASTFMDFAMRVDSVLAEAGERYGNVYDAVVDMLKKHGSMPFRIEVKEVDARLADNAKAIEVGLGKRLESAGFVADLRNPSAIVYVVFVKSTVMIGYSENLTGGNNVMDRFRPANNEPFGVINRAEFKIKEAIEFFGIDMGKVRKALDIGAAPGGWTHYLSERGAAVVAVDRGLLGYDKLIGDKRMLVLADAGEVDKINDGVGFEHFGNQVKVCAAGGQDIDFKGYDIIHIKANLHHDEEMAVLKGLGRFDMLTIDTNTHPKVSAEIADSLSGVLNPHAILVMTTKLMTMAIDEHAAAVRKVLSKNYESVKVKKLPHNRRELMVYARLKGGSY